MKNRRNHITYLLMTLVLSALSCEKPEEVGPRIDPQLAGKWELEAITYGLTQVRIQGDSLPYSEMVHFGIKNNYAISRDGKQIEAARAYTEKNMSHADFQQAIIYEKDKSYQPYKVRAGRLFLYQRSPRGTVLSDGNTYEYRRL